MLSCSYRNRFGWFRLSGTWDHPTRRCSHWNNHLKTRIESPSAVRDDRWNTIVVDTAGVGPSTVVRVLISRPRLNTYKITYDMINGHRQWSATLVIVFLILYNGLWSLTLTSEASCFALLVRFWINGDCVTVIYCRVDWIGILVAPPFPLPPMLVLTPLALVLPLPLVELILLVWPTMLNSVATSSSTSQYTVCVICRGRDLGWVRGGTRKQQRRRRSHRTEWKRN